MTTKKIKVTITTTKRCKMSFAVKSPRPLCPACGRPVEVLTRAQAASAFDITQDLLESFVRLGLLHLILAENADDLICTVSLARILTSRPPKPGDATAAAAAAASAPDDSPEK